MASLAALTDDQRRALHAVKGGANILLTGPPGAGKSFLLSHIVSWARDTGRHLGVTAMTGAAAVLLGGQTLHSFLGIGLARHDPTMLAAFVQTKMPHVVKRLRRLELLILDEISMMDAPLFAKVSQFLCIVRRDKRPFGGVQMILVGDFCQLPPVEGDYCFTSPAWRDAKIQQIDLEGSVRHKGDPVMQRLLNALRWGRCGDAETALLREMMETEFPEGIEPTRLCALNVDVDAINDGELQALLTRAGAKPVAYPVRFPKGDPRLQKRAQGWAASCKVTPVTLCVGAQVMLTRNLDTEAGLVNGARGVVISTTADQVVVRFVHAGTRTISYFKSAQEDDPHVTLEYMPLRLAWCISIHKSQGMTLDAIEIDLGRSIFADGQAYTGLSRARDMRSVRVTRFVPAAFRTSPQVLAFYGKEDE